MANNQSEREDIKIKRESRDRGRGLIIALFGGLIGIIGILCGVIISTIIGDIRCVEKELTDIRVSVAELRVNVDNLRTSNSAVIRTVPYIIDERFRWSEESNPVRPVSVPEANHVVPPTSVPTSTPAPTSGRILSPLEGNTVSVVFNYKIELLNPDVTKYYYIANRIGGLYWPKARINLRSGVTTYTGTSDEGGSLPNNGRFSIVLFEVDKTMHERISNWLNGTDFPGMQIEGRELDSVDVVLRR